MALEITQNDFKKLVPKFQRALQRSHELTGLVLEGYLKEFSPQDTGRLAGSWKWKRTGKLQSIVGTSVEYALVQNYGSDPYMIYPRRAKALRFEIDGEVIFAKEVLHPGIAPTYYIEGSIAKTNERIPELVRIALDEEGL